MNLGFLGITEIVGHVLLTDWRSSSNVNDWGVTLKKSQNDKNIQTRC